MPSLAGTQLDKYDMLEEVGHGGMAVVYRGHDTVLQREVAVKVLHAHLSDREESRLRLQREALAVAKLRHENILEIFDYSGTGVAESYIVTEFIHGPTLREWIDEQLDPRPAVAALLIHRLCLALCHAHKSGIVHRDIKPENVMIRMEDGCLKLMDFGIAQILDNQKLTLTGQLIGSPAYMAPELINGRPLDARTDLFSLGIILYQLSTGALPFNGRNPHEVLNRIADGEYPPASTVCALVDRDLEEIIAKALAANPDERYQSVETFAAELESYLEEMGIEAVSSELAAYFQDPHGYVVDLDERVCAALMERAEQAAAEGHSARAIRLLGRVLEIDGEHRAAKGMLVRLRTRERRMRQGLMAGGVLAAAGLVAAGIMLLPPTQAELASDEPADAHAMALPPGAGVPIEGFQDPDHDGRPEPVPEPDPPSDWEASTGSAAGDDTGPSPDASPGDAPRRRRPHRKAPPPRNKCSLKLEGPASVVRDVKLRIGAKTYEGAELVAVEFIGDGVDVTASHPRWHGKQRLDVMQCEGGTVPVRLSPKPATVRFTGGPSKMIVKCLDGCPGSPRDLFADAFAKIEIPIEGASGQIRVVFKARDYEHETRRFTIYPGLNKFPVELEPR